MGFGADWDLLVRKAVIICQGQGIPAIDGVDFLANIPKCHDGWHVKNTPECMELVADMVDTALNAAYAIVPQGSFAT